MTARRTARARRNLPTARVVDGVPACLKVGSCIEVWGAERQDPMVAWRRFRVVRGWWLDAAEVTDTRTACELVPLGSPWSAEYLTYHGQAERAGRPVADIVSDRLKRAGCTVDDLPDLADQAQELYSRAYREDMKRTYRRLKESTK